MGYKTNKVRQKLDNQTNVPATTYEGCSVQGIINALHELMNQAVRIDTGIRSYAGVISSVEDSIVRLEASAGMLPTIVAVCTIEAIIPVTTTANRGGRNNKGNEQWCESEKVVGRDKELNLTNGTEPNTGL